jgi:hypothetical protein
MKVKVRVKYANCSSMHVMAKLYESSTKLFGNNHQIVLSGNSKIYMGRSQQKIHWLVCKNIIFLETGQEVLNKDPNVWLD